MSVVDGKLKVYGIVTIGKPAAEILRAEHKLLGADVAGCRPIEVNKPRGRREGFRLSQTKQSGSSVPKEIESSRLWWIQ
jgi:hypothetical protein